MTLLERINSMGTTVLVVSHDDSLQPLFDRTISLSKINQAGAGHA